MDVAAHQLRRGSIDHPMPLKRRDTGEGGGGDDYVEMPAFAGPGMAFVLRAVIANLQMRRMQSGLQRVAEPLGPRAHVGSFDSYPRNSQNKRPIVNTKTTGIMSQVLKKTQVSSLMV